MLVRSVPKVDLFTHWTLSRPTRIVTPLQACLDQLQWDSRAIPNCATTLEVEHSLETHTGTKCLKDPLVPMLLQLLVDLEMAALAVVDSLLVVHLVTAAPAYHHSVLMLIVQEWHLCLVHLEEVAPEEALEVDLVVALLVHAHALATETKRNPKHSP